MRRALGSSMPTFSSWSLAFCRLRCSWSLPSFIVDELKNDTLRNLVGIPPMQSKMSTFLASKSISCHPSQQTSPRLQTVHVVKTAAVPQSESRARACLTNSCTSLERGENTYASPNGGNLIPSVAIITLYPLRSAKTSNQPFPVPPFEQSFPVFLKEY